MGFFADLKRNKFRNKSWDEAYAFRRDRKFAEAAQVYEALATDSLTYNELIYEGDCHDAMKEWLSAGEIDKALAAARKALNVIANSSWFPKDDTVEDICQMVGEFYAAGHAGAADAFAGDINTEYQKHRLPARFNTQHGKLPISCPHCGAALKFAYSETSVTCPFCGAIVHPE